MSFFGYFALTGCQPWNGLVAATLVVPIVPQAQVVRKIPPQFGCHDAFEGSDIGECVSGHGPP